MHHSDQGIQYASQSYVDRLESCGAVLSMSRYRTIGELREHITEFIDQIYNVKRLHSALAYRSPIEFEKQHESDRAWMPATLSFLRHKEIYSDV